jgi:hypothetical protein
MTEFNLTFSTKLSFALLSGSDTPTGNDNLFSPYNNHFAFVNPVTAGTGNRKK